VSSQFDGFFFNPAASAEVEEKAPWGCFCPFAALHDFRGILQWWTFTRFSTAPLLCAPMLESGVGPYCITLADTLNFVQD
jgi:hypothetical protein